MRTPWEIVSKEMIPPAHLLKKHFLGTLALFKIMLFNLGSLRKMKKQKGGGIYTRPARSYSLPEYRPDMENRSSNKKYLRPTLYCSCRSPEVTAMAHRLGAFRKGDWEFAEAAFEFTKRNIQLEMVPMDDVDRALSRGSGTCLQKVSIFVALCRAAGIPARYKFCSLTNLDVLLNASTQQSPLIKQWVDAMGNFMLHADGEAFIDGNWVTADLSLLPERQAAASFPVTRFGESSLGFWLFPEPGSIFIPESIPLGFGLSSRILMERLIASSLARFNQGIQEQVEKGRRVIEAAGGEAAYDSAIRRQLRAVADKSELLRDHGSIVFEKK